jgi:hypothetical protein
VTGHSCTFFAIERDSSGVATKWLGECQCGEDFTGPDYKDVEGQWDAHRAAQHHWEESLLFGARLRCCVRCPELWWPDIEAESPNPCTPVEVAA